MNAQAPFERSSTLPLGDAITLAGAALDELRPYCERIQIGGSIRRQLPSVHDIELVAIPRLEQLQVGLFAENVQEISTLDRYLTTQLATGGSPWQLRLNKLGRASANGPRWKALSYDGFGVDLFIVRPPAQWGVIFTIRTGPWLFAKQLVTHESIPIIHPKTNQRRYGLLPLDMKVLSGSLWQGGRRDPIPTPEESDFFAAIGVPYRDPWERI